MKRSPTLMSSLLASAAVLVAASLGVPVQAKPEVCTATPCPYLDKRLAPEVRAKDLVSRMTLDEKAAQMQDNAPAIPRLGLLRYGWWNEVLHGLARAGHTTVFPQAIGMSATWDTDLMGQIGDAIATEGRASHNAALQRDPTGTDRYYGVNYWSPNINIYRDPRWGRGQETYGEDPFLTGQMAVAFIHGIQGDNGHYYKGIATPKHFVVHSGPEPLRHGFNVNVSPFDLEDTYTPAFRAAIVEGKADSLMCAYNAVDGAPACGNPLLQQRLRGDWGFKGFVVTDCDSVDDMVTGHKAYPDAAAASAAAVKAGADLDCGSSYKALPDAVTRGLIKESELDVSLVRLMTARIRMGLIDGGAYDAIPASAINAPTHRALALRAAEEAIVLLKNDGTLPLKGTERIAVIGPNADLLQSIEGNYTGSPVDPSLPLNAMREAFGATHVVYAPGATLAGGMRTPVPEVYLKPSTDSTEQGLKAEYFDNTGFAGLPGLTRTDRVVNFDFYHTAPQGFKALGFSVRWTGIITPPAPGDYKIGFRGGVSRPNQPLADVKIWIDGNLVATPANGGPLVDFAFANTQPHTVRIDYVRDTEDRAVAFDWVPPAQPLLDGAVAAAKGSDAVIAFVGLSPDLEGEEMKVDFAGFNGGDRTSLALPQVQQDLLEAVKATGKKLVVVYLTGGEISDPWVEQNADAVIQAWYPGEAGGTAIANVLTGKTNPSGRLPYTIYTDVSDLPPFESYAMTGRTYRYFKGKVLHPFGEGLSYTRFTYEKPSLAINKIAAGKAVRASVVVRNSGKKAGDEIAQVYIAKPQDSANPVLAGFHRVHLMPGESRIVTFDLLARNLSQVDQQGNRRVVSGSYSLHFGGGQPAFTDGVALRLQVQGTVVLPK